MAILKIENRPEDGAVWVEVLPKAVIYRYSFAGVYEFPGHCVKLIGIDVDGKEQWIRSDDKDNNFLFLSENITQSSINGYAFFRCEIVLNDTDTITLTENGVSKELASYYNEKNEEI